MADFQASSLVPIHFCNNRIVCITLKFTLIWPYSTYIELRPTNEFLYSAYRLKVCLSPQKSQRNYLRRIKENIFSYKSNQL